MAHETGAPRPTLDFLVIGAQKSATSWLYYVLREHPELHLPPKKKEIHYLGGEIYRQRGAEWYFSLLSGAAPGQRTGDVSVEYLFDPRAPEEVHRFAPGVRLIASLRNPVDRAVSAFFWLLRKGRVPGDRGVDEFFQEALDAAAGAGEAGTGDEDDVPEVLARGYYARQLRRYLDLFPAERLKILLFDDIEADPGGALRRAYAFLEVDPAYSPSSMGVRPKRTAPAPLLWRLERRASGVPGLSKVFDLANRALARRGPGGVSRGVSPETRAALRAHYAPHVAELDGLVASGVGGEGVAGRSLSALWGFEGGEGG